MKSLKFLIAAPIFILLLSSCDSNRVYEKYISLENASWHRDDKAVFEVKIKDTLSHYNLYVNLRHAGNYYYKNLYLFTEIRGPENLSAIDTLQMILANNRGNWMGKGIGDLYDYSFLFKRNIKFPKEGTYIFEIEQAMREEELENVTDIGIRIEKTEIKEDH